MHKVDHRHQVVSGVETPFDITLRAMRVVKNPKAHARPLVTLSYGHASTAWQKMKDWFAGAPDVTYFYAEDGVGLYGTNEHDELCLSVFIHKKLPGYAQFKSAQMGNHRLSMIIHTEKFGYFEVTLLKDADAYHCIEGTVYEELSNVDNTGEDPKAGA